MSLGTCATTAWRSWGKNFLLMSHLNFPKLNVQAEFLQLAAVVPCGISCHYQEESGGIIS